MLYESFIPHFNGWWCNRVNWLYVFNTPKENEPLEGPNTNSNIIPQTQLKQQPAIGAMTRPQTGISTLIGKGTQTVLEKYGEPARKEPSSFGYQCGSTMKMFQLFYDWY